MWISPRTFRRVRGIPVPLRGPLNPGILPVWFSEMLRKWCHYTITDHQPSQQWVTSVFTLVRRIVPRSLQFRLNLDRVGSVGIR